MRELNVEEVMTTAVIALDGKATIAQAEQEMQRADIRHLLVVDPHQRLIGILSDRDVLAALGQAGGKPTAISRVMSRDVITVRPDTLAREAVNLMIDRKIDSLPVVGDQGQLVGIVTSTDFLRIASQALGGDRVDPAEMGR